jgi:hypothetical protein
VRPVNSVCNILQSNEVGVQQMQPSFSPLLFISSHVVCGIDYYSRCSDALHTHMFLPSLVKQLSHTLFLFLLSSYLAYCPCRGSDSAPPYDAGCYWSSTLLQVGQVSRLCPPCMLGIHGTKTRVPITFRIRHYPSSYTPLLLSFNSGLCAMACCYPVFLHIISD